MLLLNERLELLRDRLNVPPDVPLSDVLRDSGNQVREEYVAILREFGMSGADIPLRVFVDEYPRVERAYRAARYDRVIKILMWVLIVSAIVTSAAAAIVGIVRHVLPAGAP